MRPPPINEIRYAPRSPNISPRPPEDFTRKAKPFRPGREGGDAWTTRKGLGTPTSSEPLTPQDPIILPRATDSQLTTRSSHASIDTYFASEREDEDAESSRMLPVGTLIVKTADHSPAALMKVSKQPTPDPPPPEHDKRKSVRRLFRHIFRRRSADDRVATQTPADRSREEDFFENAQQEEARRISTLHAKMGKGEINKKLTQKFQDMPEEHVIRAATTKRLDRIKELPSQGITLRGALGGRTLNKQATSRIDTDEFNNM